MDGNGNASLPASRRFRSRIPAIAVSVSPARTSGKRRGEGLLRHVDRPFDQRDLAGILSFAQRLHQLHRGSPLPTAALLQQVAGNPDAAGAPTRSRRDRRRKARRDRPTSRSRDSSSRFVRRMLADLLANLRGVSEIGEQDALLRRDEKQCVASGEAGDIADVGKAAHEQSVQVGASELVAQRDEPMRSVSPSLYATPVRATPKPALAMRTRSPARRDRTPCQSLRQQAWSAGAPARAHRCS